MQHHHLFGLFGPFIALSCVFPFHDTLNVVLLVFLLLLLHYPWAHLFQSFGWGFLPANLAGCLWSCQGIFTGISALLSAVSLHGCSVGQSHLVNQRQVMTPSYLIFYVSKGLIKNILWSVISYCLWSSCHLTPLFWSLDQLMCITYCKSPLKCRFVWKSLIKTMSCIIEKYIQTETVH